MEINSNQIKQHLIHYLNGAILSPSDYARRFLFPDRTLRLYAEELISQFSERKTKLIKGKNNVDVHIPVYSGTNRMVHAIMNELNQVDISTLHSVLIVGSLADGETTGYSDFDGVIILRRLILENPVLLADTAKLLGGLWKYVIEFDPLQHHGWFVLIEDELLDYRELYLPIAALNQAQSLYPRMPLTLNIHYNNENQDFSSGIDRLSLSIIKQIDRREYPKNIYYLKDFFSRFMLLPVLYVQALFSRGLAKKDSFDLARKDFSADVWSIMDDVSDIRQNWNYNMTGFRRRLLTSPHPLIRRIGKQLAPPIPDALKNQLTLDFYDRMKRLAACMISKLSADGSH